MGRSIIEGSADLIVQMLDKLIDNAVDFSPAGATITVRLAAEPAFARIEVENPGTAAAVGDARQDLRVAVAIARRRDSRPHFGLGLYIVRLIAEFHGGHAQARESFRRERSSLHDSSRASPIADICKINKQQKSEIGFVTLRAVFKLTDRKKTRGSTRARVKAAPH